METVTHNDLPNLNKPVLVEMTRILTGKVGDSARNGKEHYVELLRKHPQGSIDRAYTAALEKAPAKVNGNGADDSAAHDLVEALNRLVKPKQADTENVAELVQQAKDEMGAELEAALESKVNTLRDEMAKGLELLAKNTKPQVQIEKVVVAQAVERKVEGKTHKVFDKVVKLAALRKNILLVGPAGCGKTKLAHQVAESLGLSYFGISCTAGMSESQLTGWLIPVGEGGKFVYVPSNFVNAYENGGLFLLDEADAADANVLMVVNQALANGGFFIPQRTDNPFCKRHADFVCIAAANTFGHGGDMIYAGRERLDGATLDRFRSGIVHMDYDGELEQSLIDSEVLKWGTAIRKQISDMKLRRVMSTRVLIDFTDQKAAYQWGKAEWEASYFCDWTADELNKVGVSRNAGR